MRKVMVVILCLVLFLFIVFYGLIICLRIKVGKLVRSATDPNVAYDLSYVNENDYEKISQLLIQIGEIDDNGYWDLGDNMVISTSFNPSHFDSVIFDFETKQFVVSTSYASEIEFVDGNQISKKKGGSYYFRVFLDWDSSTMQWNVVEVELINPSY